MVLISSTKYACETCIKGHRSSACKHTDRPLYEIKKKGRPVTQCEHCRELRKTKQVHVKCICESKEQTNSTANPAGPSRKGGSKLPATAAFPNGLPESMEASVGMQLLSEGSSDSDHCGDYSSASNCKCKSGGQCNCCTPRKSATTRRRSSAGDKHHEHSKHSHPSSLFNSPPPAHVLARIAELRPVLPRPSKVEPPNGPLHDPSTRIAHGHTSRHHAHDIAHFSPYGRAYEHAHTVDHTFDQHRPFAQGSRHPPQHTPSFVEQAPPRMMMSGVGTNNLFPSACTCGDSCQCPGCSQHNNAPIPATGAFSSCSNPEDCSFCLDCTILALPSTLPPDTMSTLFDTSQSQDMDEWLGQASPTPYPLASAMPGLSMTQFDQFGPTPDWEKTPPASITQTLPNYRGPTACCNGLCQCSQGSCRCPTECCGCCHGCKCEKPCPNGNFPTFAVSGERNSCCSQKQFQSDIDRSHLNRGDTMGGFPLNVAIPTQSYASSLLVPDMQSRSSSSSSGSSSHPYNSPTHKSNIVKTFSQPSPLSAASLSGPNASNLMGPYRSAQSSASVSPQPTSPMSGVSCGDPAGYASSAVSEGSHRDSQYDVYAQYSLPMDAMHLKGK